MNDDNAYQPNYQEIEVGRFRAVWKHLKIKVPVEDFMNTYDTWESIYKHDVVQTMSLGTLEMLKPIFFFKGETLDQCKQQFTNFIGKHKEFYNDNLQTMIMNMVTRRNELNYDREARGQFPLEHINLFPEYGGKLQKSRTAAKYEEYIYEQAGAIFPWQNTELEEAMKPKRRRKTDDEE